MKGLKSFLKGLSNEFYKHSVYCMNCFNRKQYEFTKGIKIVSNKKIVCGFCGNKDTIRLSESKFGTKSYYIN